MQAMYQADIRNEPIDSIIDHFLTETTYFSSTKDWAIHLAKTAWEKREELDIIIEKYAIGWDLERINTIDKNLLRLALYELKYTATPLNVVLNEVIEISKKYSTDDSPKFINGILGNFVKQECLPAS